METCTYSTVPEQISDENVKSSWTPFLRQLLVCSVIWMCFFMYGMGFGGPTVIIPQIRKEANSSEAVSEEMASWLSAVYGYGGTPWTIILPIAASRYGRKIPFIFVCAIMFVAYIIFFTSNSVIQILVAEVMESTMGATVNTITIMIMTEYTSPKYRGWFLTLNFATLFWGIWTSNAIGTFFHWKIIGLVKLVCSVYPFIILFWLPESPYWLASKGKFDQCTIAHKWLKGSDTASENELKTLINTQNNKANKLIRSKRNMLHTFKFIIKKEFYKPTLFSSMVVILYSLSGKLACTFYSLDIIGKITQSETAAYTGMLILDGFTVLGMYIGCVLSSFLKRRTLLLISSTIGVLCLFILSLYVYLIKLLIITENQYLSISLLTLYSLGICCGPIIMSKAIFAELLPLSYRSTAVSIIAMLDKLLLGTVLKLTPFMVNKFGLHVAFAFFGVSSGVCVIFIYKYLPETKDKTLYEIASIMKGNIRERDTTKSYINKNKNREYLETKLIN